MAEKQYLAVKMVDNGNHGNDTLVFCSVDCRDKFRYDADPCGLLMYDFEVGQDVDFKCHECDKFASEVQET